MTTKESIIEVLKSVNDPEINMDVYSLELIRDVSIENDIAKITMTLTTPMCPYGPALVEEIKTKVQEVEGIKEARIEVSFDPPWEPSAELRATLGV